MIQLLFSQSLNLSQGLNLSVKKGELIAVVGPVACGKTTLLMSLIQVSRQDIFYPHSSTQYAMKYLTRGKSKKMCAVMMSDCLI
jgi:ABC-type sugar transport system ATPase subunit